MKYEKQTKEHLVELINKRGESGKGALGYILYKAESKRLERLYTKANLESGIIHFEYEDALGNFYLYMWNGRYFETLKDPNALGAWIGKIFYRFLLRDWQIIKKLERAISVKNEERMEYAISEQMKLALHKTALTLALINQTQLPERKYAFFRKVLKGYLRLNKQKLPPYELTDYDVAYVMGIKDARYRQWAKRVKDDVQRMVKTMNKDQLVCLLTADSLTLAERICDGGRESITDWIKELIEQTEEQLKCCDEICRFREGLRSGRYSHIIPKQIHSVPTPSAEMKQFDRLVIMKEIEDTIERLSETNSSSNGAPFSQPKFSLRMKKKPRPRPLQEGYVSILEKMLGI